MDTREDRRREQSLRAYYAEHKGEDCEDFNCLRAATGDDGLCDECREAKREREDR